MLYDQHIWPFRICCTVAALSPGQQHQQENGVAMTSQALCLSVGDVETVFGCFVRCLGDYTMDSRGDIGATVREASMGGIRNILTGVASYDSSLLTPSMCVGDFRQIMCF